MEADDIDDSRPSRPEEARAERRERSANALLVVFRRRQERQREVALDTGRGLKDRVSLGVFLVKRRFWKGSWWEKCVRHRMRIISRAKCFVLSGVPFRA